MNAPAPGSRRRTVAAIVTVVAALAFAVAVTGRGCRESDSSPDGAVRALISAARAEDKHAFYDLLGPHTQARLQAAAETASERAGGPRRFTPVDVLDLSPHDGAYRLDVKDRTATHATVVVILDDGTRWPLDVVKVDGRWRIELPDE